MLVESMDSDFSFQLVCISGYKAGVIFGFIRKDPIAMQENLIAVTYEFLLEQMLYNLGEIDLATYEVIKKQ